MGCARLCRVALAVPAAARRWGTQPIIGFLAASMCCSEEQNREGSPILFVL